MDKNKFWDNKKGAHQFVTLFVVVLAFVGAVSLVLMLSGKAKAPTGLSITQTGQQVAGQGTMPGTPVINLVEDTTVSFSSWDFYAEATNAGTGHFAIKLGNKKAKQYNDDGTDTASPGDAYIVLLGNRTTDLIAGTNYYPVVKQGAIPDKGDFAIAGGQYLSAGKAQLTFSFFDSNGDTNTVQAMGANDEAKMSWKIEANDNVCIGNPDTGGLNKASYTYNNTVFSKVASISSTGAELSKVATPTGVNTSSGMTTDTYTFPIICDNADFTQRVLLKSLNVEVNGDNDANITIHDVSWDYDADTLALISDVVDEDNNDVGVDDYIIGGLRVS